MAPSRPTSRSTAATPPSCPSPSCRRPGTTRGPGHGSPVHGTRFALGGSAAERDSCAVRISRLSALPLMPFAAALSEHPEAPEAVGEVVGAVFEQIEQTPDLALLFIGPAHAERAGEVAAAVRALLRPRVLLGCTA